MVWYMQALFLIGFVPGHIWHNIAFAGAPGPILLNWVIIYRDLIFIFLFKDSHF